MAGELEVATAHVRELAAKQKQAAAEIAAATAVTDGVDTSVRFSHGVIAWSTAAAVEAAGHARSAAGAAMERTSTALGDNLTTAAGQYDQTDRIGSGLLDAQIRPR